MRLIDIEDMGLLKTVSCGGLSAKKLWKRIKEQPTIDAVEVVRCKNCLYRDNSCGMGEHKWCRCLNQTTSPDDYCSYGKRREDSEA